MKVGNQEQICVKLDSTSVIMLKVMSQSTCVKKNRLINDAIRHYYMTSEWK